MHMWIASYMSSQAGATGKASTAMAVLLFHQNLIFIKQGRYHQQRMPGFLKLFQSRHLYVYVCA